MGKKVYRWLWCVLKDFNYRTNNGFDWADDVGKGFDAQVIIAATSGLLHVHSHKYPHYLLPELKDQTGAVTGVFLDINPKTLEVRNYHAGALHEWFDKDFILDVNAPDCYYPHAAPLPFERAENIEAIKSLLIN